MQQLKDILKKYNQEMEAELSTILEWWIAHSIDEQNGGFYGQINNINEPNLWAEKGLVLNARILWTFSAASIFANNVSYKNIADRAFQYCETYFLDKKNGGCFWAVDAKGNPSNTRKQIYGLAFMIYGLTEYYKTNHSENVLTQAKALFYWIEKYSYDVVNGGYFEAFDIDGSPLNDLRLSPKDRNDPKTMNTHLHILEAYTNLYRIWKDDFLKERIQHLIDLFLTHFIHAERKTLILFFSENWITQDDSISYGHDIEASWLIYEAAEVIDYNTNKVANFAVDMAKAAFTGIDKSGAMLYENHRLEKHWWVQAEAMVGFLNAFQLTGDFDFLEKSLNCWAFTQNYIIDQNNGEWFWGLDVQNVVMANEDKAGFWKCPYHNGRACMEIAKRIRHIEKNRYINLKK